MLDSYATSAAPLPALHLTPVFSAASPKAPGGVAESVTCNTADSQGRADMSADTFEEDWQRPPGDIAYLQDLLQSLEKPSQPSPHGAHPAAPVFTAPSTAAKNAGATRRDRDRDGEEEDVAAVQVREKQISVIEKRRRRAQNRCDAVDAAFAKSVERRMRAMQHLACDPPAERLVGQGMTQYVPAALLPDEVLDEQGRLRPGPLPLLPHSVVETHVQHQQQLASGPGHAHNGGGGVTRASTSSQAATAAITDGGANRKTNEADALVFLTQLDAGGKPERTRAGGSRVSGASDRASASRGSSAGDGGASRTAVGRGAFEPQGPTRGSGGESQAGLRAEGTLSTADDDDARSDADDAFDGVDETWMRPANVTAANKDRWRELGYHVVVVGGSSSSGGGGRGGERAAAQRAYDAAAAARVPRPSLRSQQHLNQQEGEEGEGEGDSPSPVAASATRLHGSGERRRQPTASASAPTRTTNSTTTTHTTKTTQGEGSWRWTTLAPLPPVCLIQRRLPEEDMTPSELRHRQATSSRAGSRRRPDTHGETGRVWKTSGK